MGNAQGRGQVEKQKEVRSKPLQIQQREEQYLEQQIRYQEELRAQSDSSKTHEFHDHVVAPLTGEQRRVILIGDVHGCFDELQALLKGLAYDKTYDQLVLLGDLVAKGPKSLEVVRFAMREGCVVVRGNWETLALEVVDEWLGGKKASKKARKQCQSFAPSFSPEEVAWLRAMPHTVRLPHLQAIAVHAGLVPGVPLEQQTDFNMENMRALVELTSKGGDEERNKTTMTTTTTEGVVQRERANLPLPSPRYTTSDDKDDGKSWASLWPGPEHVYFGHDAGMGLQLCAYATGLDTGCCKGKSLTASVHDCAPGGGGLVGSDSDSETGLGFFGFGVGPQRAGGGKEEEGSDMTAAGAEGSLLPVPRRRMFSIKAFETDPQAVVQELILGFDGDAQEEGGGEERLVVLRQEVLHQSGEEGRGGTAAAAAAGGGAERETCWAR